MTRRVRIFFIIVILLLAAGAGAFLYFQRYGKGIVENVLSDALGMDVRFKGVSLKLKDYSVNFKGLSMPAKPGFKDDLFTAENFTLTINEERFRENREFIIERLIIEDAAIHIERNQKGVFNIPARKKTRTSRKPGRPRPGGKDQPRRYKPPGTTPFYDFGWNMKNLIISNCTIEFRDHYLYGVPFTTSFDNVSLQIKSGREEETAGGYIPIEATLDISVPTDRYRGRGHASLKADIAAYQYMTDMEWSLQTNNVDLMQFLPYFQEYTPFLFTEGLFSSSASFRMHNNVIKGLMTIVFSRLRLSVKPGMENSEFLHTSISRLLPYLTSGSGEIVFDFTVTGTPEHPQFGLGPRVQEAIGMVVAESIVNLLQQLQNMQ